MVCYGIDCDIKSMQQIPLNVISHKKSYVLLQIYLVVHVYSLKQLAFK